MLNLHKIFLPEDTLHKRKKTPLYVSIERPCHCPLDWLVVDYEHHSGMLTSANLGKEGESTFFVLFSERLFHFNPRPIHLNPYPQIQSSESFFILTNSLPHDLLSKLAVGRPQRGQSAIPCIRKRQTLSRKAVKTPAQEMSTISIIAVKK